MDIQAQITEAEAKVAELKQIEAQEKAAARRARIAAVTTTAGQPLNFVDGSDLAPATYKGRAHVKVGDITIQVAVSRGWNKDDRKKARVYVSGADDVDFTEAYAATNADAEKKGSYPIRGDYPETDKMFDRLNRQVIKNERALVEAAIAASPELAALVGSTKLHFSRHAGCSCPCSPGFIAASHIEAIVGDRLGNVTDIWISKEVAK